MVHWSPITSVSFFFKVLFIYFYREGKRVREGVKHERNNQLPLTGSHWGPGPQPRHVPWLGIKPATFQFTGWPSIHWATPARANNITFISALKRWTLIKAHSTPTSWLWPWSEEWEIHFNGCTPTKHIYLAPASKSMLHFALAGVALLVECHLAKWKVTSLIPGQGTCLDYGFSAQLGHTQEATDWCFSLSLSPSLTLSLKRREEKRNETYIYS